MLISHPTCCTTRSSRSSDNGHFIHIIHIYYIIFTYIVSTIVQSSTPPLTCPQAAQSDPRILAALRDAINMIKEQRAAAEASQVWG
jgi:hypothetical protein